jgi:hypothetical protein
MAGSSTGFVSTIKLVNASSNRSSPSTATVVEDDDDDEEERIHVNATGNN